MKEIPLNHGRLALVDDDDYERIAAYKWHAVRQKRKNKLVSCWYAVWTGPRPAQKSIYMHRVLLGLDDSGPQVDHLNGDGHRRADGRTCIVQKSKRGIDAMQMLALRLGYRAHLSRRTDGQYTLYLTRGAWLTLRGTNGTHTALPTEHYTGTVWCPSVPTGFWLARRDGKPFITGNTFPPKLVEPLVRVSTSERGGCPACGAPWKRLTEKAYVKAGGGSYGGRTRDSDPRESRNGHIGTTALSRADITTGWAPSCSCPPAAPQPQVVLDPFSGAGTTGLVASRLGRDYIGIELSPVYAAMSESRIRDDAPLLADVVTTAPATYAPLDLFGERPA
jgi:hypothetical protein